MTTSPNPARDPFWDALRATALARVVAWHTWSWTPLSWFAAIPAMFLTAGALLQPSIARRGFSATLRSRLRRLLLPYLAYSAVATSTMALLGWRPDLSTLSGVTAAVAWVVPLADPVGSNDAPGLWVPLWYLRTYLWLLLASGFLAFAARRLGWFLPALLGSAFAAQQIALPNAPMPVADFLLYAPFLASGMVIATRARPSVAASTALALGVGVPAVWLTVNGSLPMVVNESYAATALAGVATVGAVFAAVGVFARLGTGSFSRLVSWMGARSLTIYLWHGFGLFASDRLVAQRGVDGVAGFVLAGSVVLATTALAAFVFGPLEDLAAARTSPSRRPSFPQLRTLVSAGTLVALATSTLMLTPPTGVSATLPLSGRGVLEAAQNRADDAPVPAASFTPAPRSAPLEPALAAARTERVAAFLDTWAADNAAEYERREVGFVNLAVATNDGAVTLLRWEQGRGTSVVENASFDSKHWFSISKAATAAWLYRLDEQGVLDVDDPVGRFLPEVPHGDKITLLHLATHRSGIPASFDAEPGADTDAGADARAWIRDGSIAATPGEGFEYSRIGYTLLAWALERASGTSWRSAVSTMAELAGVEIGFDEDTAAARRVDRNRHPGEGRYLGPLYAGGGLLGTVPDLARFYHWVFTAALEPGSVDSWFTHDPSRFAGFYGAGLGLGCPCNPSPAGQVASRGEHAAFLGYFLHDRIRAATVVVNPEHHMGTEDSDPLFLPLFHGPEFQAALLDAISPRSSVLPGTHSRWR